MVSGIENVGSNFFAQSIGKAIPTKLNAPLHDFNTEDQAIISAEAKMLYELDKFNSGSGNEVDLALSCVMAEHQTGAAVKVVNTKTEMLDTVLKLGEDKKES